MPNYEYLCPDGHKTERFLSMEKMHTEVRCTEVVTDNAGRGWLCGKLATRIMSVTGKPVIR